MTFIKKHPVAEKRKAIYLCCVLPIKAENSYNKLFNSIKRKML